MTMEEQESKPETAVNPSPSSNAKPDSRDRERRGELIKFGLLVLIFVGVILVVAVSRPLIFDRVLPSIVQPAPFATEMGIGGAQDSPVDTSQESPMDAAPAEGAVDAAAESTLFLPATSVEAGGGAPTQSEADEVVSPEPASESAPAEPAAPQTFHTVQVGDTLTRIANQYNVPVQTLMEANGLINPNYIQVGQRLVIPTPPSP